MRAIINTENGQLISGSNKGYFGPAKEATRHQVFVPCGLLGEGIFNDRLFQCSEEGFGFAKIQKNPKFIHPRGELNPDDFGKYRVEVELHRPYGGTSLGVVSGTFQEIKSKAISKARRRIRSLPKDYQINQSSIIRLIDFSGNQITTIFWD